MKKWLNAEGIGQLYIEEVLVYGDFPVLFVCIDDNKQRYLCMAFDPFESQFVIIRISTEKLIDMLENRISMEQTFRDADEIITTEDSESSDNNADIVLTANDSSTFPADHLPVVGECYDLPSEWLNTYLTQLKQELNAAAVDVRYSEPLKETQGDTFHITYKTKMPVAVLIYGNIADNTSFSSTYAIVSGKYNVEKGHNHSSNAYSSNAPDDFDNRAA